MKKVFVCLLGLAVASSAHATTKTVGKSGAQFTSIQAAINSFTQAELSDGTPDVVEIIDGEEYDEQVMIGGLVPNPEAENPGYLDQAIENAVVRDPFTLRGADENNRPSINPVNAAMSTYGVFTDDPGDNFLATFTYFGKDITVENVEIIQSNVADPDQYGMNGQAGNMTFRNVLFAHGGTAEPGEALINFNNDVSLVNHGIDNSYTFIDCTFDAAVGDERGKADTIYFHGYSQGDVDAAGVTAEQAAVRVDFQGCHFLNSDVAMIIRGRAQPNHVTIDRSFFTNSAHGVRGSGKGTLTVTNSIFYQNAIMPDDFGSDFGAIEAIGREQNTPAVTVLNSLFVDNLDPASFEGSAGFNTRAAVIRIQNDGNDPDVEIVGNTFVNSPIALRFVDAQGRPRTGTVSNNIFQNVDIVFTSSDTNGGYLDSPNAADGVEELVVTGENNIFDNVTIVVEENEELPNVEILGETASVTFNNTTINPDDPFAGPPYVVASGAPEGVGADLRESTDVQDYMLH